MSGIIGVWSSQCPTPWQTLLDDLTVLGQDGKGDWHDRTIGLSLGRTQLFNTPESCLEAPVVEVDGCVLVWDGRLDDRDALLAGRTGVTDAQLIIESYRRWGTDCLRHLIGEFVFILWDASQDTLFVGCDRVGCRTIAYVWDGQTLLLSSRVLTLLLHPQVSHELDEVYMAHTICDFWAHPPEITPFKAIKRLRPGYGLILHSGRLQQRQIAQLATSDRPDRPSSPETYYEKFWHLLNQAVHDRLRNHRPVCTTLSGGLDSTTVTVSLLNHLANIDAFSVTSALYPAIDESEPIQAFLNHYPQVRWNPVNCDDAWVLSEPWEQLPIPDDPFTSCVVPMHLRIMQQVQQMGFGLIFDGEWGDEFCYVFWRDRIRAGDWKLVFQQLKSPKNWRSFLWRELLLPQLPQRWQSHWVASRLQQTAFTPEWVKPAYAQQQPTQIARQQTVMKSVGFDRVKALTQEIEDASFVGVMQTHRLLRSVYQLEYSSPLRDQRIVEFANGLPHSLQLDPSYQKIFLRQANQATLPDQVRLRPKVNYFDPLKYAGLGKGNQALEFLEQAKHNSYLQEVFDLKQLGTALLSYRQTYLQNHSSDEPFNDEVANRLCSALNLSNWLTYVDKRYLSRKVARC